jgi:hypothetical protein
MTVILLLVFVLVLARPRIVFVAMRGENEASNGDGSVEADEVSRRDVLQKKNDRRLRLRNVRLSTVR